MFSRWSRNKNWNILCISSGGENASFHAENYLHFTFIYHSTIKRFSQASILPSSFTVFPPPLPVFTKELDVCFPTMRLLISAQGEAYLSSASWKSAKLFLSLGKAFVYDVLKDGFGQKRHRQNFFSLLHQQEIWGLLKWTHFMISEAFLFPRDHLMRGEEHYGSERNLKWEVTQNQCRGAWTVNTSKRRVHLSDAVLDHRGIHQTQGPFWQKNFIKNSQWTRQARQWVTKWVKRTQVTTQEWE